MTDFQRIIFKNKLIAKKHDENKFNNKELCAFTNSIINKAINIQNRTKVLTFNNYINTIKPFLEFSPRMNSSSRKTSLIISQNNKSHRLITNSSKHHQKFNHNSTKNIFNINSPSIPSLHRMNTAMNTKMFIKTSHNKNDILSSFTNELSKRKNQMFLYTSHCSSPTAKVAKPSLISHSSKSIFSTNREHSKLTLKRAKELKKFSFSSQEIEFATLAYNLRKSTEKYFSNEINKTISSVKYKDEYNDKVYENENEKLNLRKKIRDCLLKDINETKNPYIHDTFFQNKANKINFIDDIYHVPVFRNKFLFHDKEGILEKIANPNYIEKEYKITISKARREKIFKEDKLRNKTYFKSLIQNAEIEIENEKQKENNKLFRLQMEKYFVLPCLTYNKVKIINDSKLKLLIYNL